MAKRKKTQEPEKQEALSEYYKLNTKAVDDLVTANRENSPQVSEEELRKYRSGSKIRLSDTVKALLIKVWFAGAVCFFFLWGLGIYVSNQLDQLLILGVAMGFVTDLLTNNVFRFYAKTPGANNRWMMVTRKGFVSLPLNLLYAFVLLFFVFMTYNVLNAFMVSFTGVQDSVPLGVEPILFGVFTTAWDMLFITIKRMAGRMVADARRAER